MSEYVITINSTSDLPKEWVWEREIPVVPLNCTIGGKTYRDMYDLTAEEFYGGITLNKFEKIEVEKGNKYFTVKDNVVYDKDVTNIMVFPTYKTTDRKSTRLNSSHDRQSRMPSSA